MRDFYGVEALPHFIGVAADDDGIIPPDIGGIIEFGFAVVAVFAFWGAVGVGLGESVGVVGFEEQLAVDDFIPFHYDEMAPSCIACIVEPVDVPAVFFLVSDIIHIEAEDGDVALVDLLSEHLHAAQGEGKISHAEMVEVIDDVVGVPPAATGQDHISCFPGGSGKSGYSPFGGHDSRGGPAVDVAEGPGIGLVDIPFVTGLVAVLGRTLHSQSEDPFLIEYGEGDGFPGFMGGQAIVSNKGKDNIEGLLQQGYSEIHFGLLVA